MQAIAPGVDRNPNGHTAAEILAALQGRSGSRRLTFRYELLDSDNVKIRDLDNVAGGSVDQNWLADIKRTATFDVRETDVEIDYLADRIKPYVRLLIPPYGADDWAEWPQGVFLLSSPARESDPVEQVTRSIDGYDLLQLYADDAVADRYIIASGAPYTDEVRVLLDTDLVNITSSPAVLPVAREWEPGTTKLRIINDLLDAINYDSLSFDEDGTPQAHPYRPPAERGVEYHYANDSASVIYPGVTQTLDLYSVPNRWVLTVSQPDRPVITSVATNDDPSSATSTVRRGRNITDFRTDQDAVDQTTLDAKVQRLALEATQVYEQVEFSTALMPIHSGNDCLRFTHSALSIDAPYIEHSWSMDLTAGAEMHHRVRRVVNI